MVSDFITTEELKFWHGFFHIQRTYSSFLNTELTDQAGEEISFQYVKFLRKIFITWAYIAEFHNIKLP